MLRTILSQCTHHYQIWYLRGTRLSQCIPMSGSVRTYIFFGTLFIAVACLVINPTISSCLCNSFDSFARIFLQMLLGRIVFCMLRVRRDKTISTRRTWSILGPNRTATTQMYTFLFTDHAYVYAAGVLLLCDVVFGQGVRHG
jgi:hypothetical protein